MKTKCEASLRHRTELTVNEKRIIEGHKVLHKGHASAYFMIFDRRPKAKELSWDEKISWTVDKTSNITILGC
jgi:hypothetical protein